MKLSEYTFRDLYKQCVIIKHRSFESAKEAFLEHYSYTPPKNMNAILCLCYIDSTCGMSFHFLTFADFETGEVDFLCYRSEVENNVMLITRYDENIEAKIYKGDMSVFDERLKLIDKHYHNDVKVLPTRNIKEIDHLRYNINPDDIRVLLRKEGLQIEQVWVRLTEIENGNLTGILLNEPNSDFGVNANDRVHVQITTRGNDIYAICLLPNKTNG
jgi:hypothetical protein